MWCLELSFEIYETVLIAKCVSLKEVGLLVYLDLHVSNQLEAIIIYLTTLVIISTDRNVR